MELNGKVAVITGAASGIGHGIAKRFAEAGGRVCIADLNIDAAKAAASEIGDEKVAIAVAMDVSNEDEVNAGVDAAANFAHARHQPRAVANQHSNAVTLLERSAQPVARRFLIIHNE